MDKTTLYIVPYTHWDREFRWEFERTRMRLVDCIDHVLQCLEEDPEYRSFLLDGQMTLIDDYLEIRPENRDRIARLVQAGRLEIGPWYTLPDCAPLHGECVIRNLMCGFRMANEFGGSMRVGYSVFSFGQIAQLPQLYANFGIDTIFFYKHMDPSRAKYHEFIWEAPDGTRALASRLGREARWNFFFAAHIPIAYDRDPWRKDWQYRWGDELGKIFHLANPEDYAWFHDVLDPIASLHPRAVEDAVDRALDTVKGTACPSAVLMFDGTDFTEPHPLTPQMYDEIRRQCGERVDVIHSTLSAYAEHLKNALRDRDDLDIVTGSMRDGPVGSVHSDVISIHPELLIANANAEKLLLRYAEPLSTLAWVFGIDAYPKTYLDKAWKLMFQSHAHDSLHGLGPKTLVDGETARLNQATVIGEGLAQRGLQNITKEIDTASVTDASCFLSVFNTATFERSEIVEAVLDIPSGIDPDRVVIEDPEGRQVMTQESSREHARAGIYHPRSRNMPYYCTRVHLCFPAEDIPAMGYRVYKVKWVAKPDYPYPHEDWDAPRVYADSLLTAPYRAENEYIILSVNTDGTFNITDKETNRTYSGLNYFLDQGDIGNMWMADPPARDQVICSAGRPAEVALRLQGPLMVVFDINLTMNLPAEFDWGARERSSRRREMPIHIELTLKKGSPFVEVTATVKNNIKDHFLRVCFPTGIASGRTWAEAGLAVTNYPASPSRHGGATGDAYRGHDLARHPAQFWFDLWDGENGLAVLLASPRDYEIVEHTDPGTMAMSVLRGVRLRIPCDNRLWMEYPGDESAQALGPCKHTYALMPHALRWDHARLSCYGVSFRHPLKVCQFGRQAGQFPLAKSFLALEGANLILAAFKQAEDRNAVIVRFVNTTVADTEMTLHVGFPFKEAWTTTLNEDRLNQLQFEGSAVKVPAGKGKIITVELVL